MFSRATNIHPLYIYIFCAEFRFDFTHAWFRATVVWSNDFLFLLDFSVSKSHVFNRALFRVGNEMGQDKLLVITDQVTVSISAVFDAIKVVRKEGVEKVDPLIITQVTSQSKLLILIYFN